MDQMFTVTLSERAWDEIQMAIAADIKTPHGWNRPGLLAEAQNTIDDVIVRTHRDHTTRSI